MIAAEEGVDMDSNPSEDSMEVVSTQPRKRDPRKYYAKELMVPEWLVSLPQPLNGHWLVAPRPEGKHCLVISAKNCTTSRLRTGDVLHRFESVLPDGGHLPGGGHGNCILDCIYQEVRATVVGIR